LKAETKNKQMRLVFATNNTHKIHEIQKLIDPSIELLSLKDIGCEDEIPEDQQTLEGNAAQKSFFIYDRYGVNCFADDTGLEIEALDGEPGVISARYAGEERDAEKNMNLVLDKLSIIKNRKARFRTVISLVIDGRETQFEGVVEGHILKEKRGNTGFGYDPIFQPEESDLSFAQMPVEQKNKISHRGRAVQKLVEYLTQIDPDDKV
jgi:XTP/dITP diphosphohydrolase